MASELRKAIKKKFKNDIVREAAKTVTKTPTKTVFNPASKRLKDVKATATDMGVRNSTVKRLTNKGINLGKKQGK
jgi:hypothetical protein